METLQIQKVRKKLKSKKCEVSILEKVLMNYNKKTNVLVNFTEYVIVKTILNKYLCNFYENIIFRKLNYKSSINKLKTETNLVNKIKKTFTKDKENKKEIVLVYGDWSRKSQMRGCISTPNIGLKRMLAKNFKIYNIDEFKTSCIDHYTKKENVKAIVSVTKGEKIMYKSLHSVLVSKIQGNKEKKDLMRFQNRNRNAVLNMHEIYECCLNGKPRPEAFQRDKKVSDAAVQPLQGIDCVKTD